MVERQGVEHAPALAHRTAATARAGSRRSGSVRRSGIEASGGASSSGPHQLCPHSLQIHQTTVSPGNLTTFAVVAAQAGQDGRRDENVGVTQGQSYPQTRRRRSGSTPQAGPHRSDSPRLSIFPDGNFIFRVRVAGWRTPRAAVISQLSRTTALV